MKKKSKLNEKEQRVAQGERTHHFGGDSILRILDANMNRCREGIRVLEDAVRFSADDETLSSSLKEMRHGLREAWQRLEICEAELLAARDAEGDVGSKNSSASELARAGLNDILKANCKRIQESLRVLEEFSKIRNPQASMLFKKLRFTAYELEAEVFERLR